MHALSLAVSPTKIRIRSSSSSTIKYGSIIFFHKNNNHTSQKNDHQISTSFARCITIFLGYMVRSCEKVIIILRNTET